MKYVIERLGLRELPVLYLLDEVIKDQKYNIEEEVRQDIVLTYGRALIMAIKMKEEEATKAKGETNVGAD
jgi:hypothetical protein